MLFRSSPTGKNSDPISDSYISDAHPQQYDIPELILGFNTIEWEKQRGFFTTGGLAAVHSEGRSKEEIWDALQRKEMPQWLIQEDLDYLVSQFEKAGFKGGVNYYRNLDTNWEITKDIEDLKIKVPTLFISGKDDMVIRGASGRRA